MQARWRTARDTYMKVKANSKKLKSGSGAKSGKKYTYYNMLTFLDSNAGGEADESIDNNLSEDQNSSTNDNNISVPSTSAENLNPENFSNTELETSRKRKRTQSPTPFEKQLLQSVRQNNLLNDDEDLNFFKSLIPTVKKFSTFKKLLFRTKVLEAMIDIEKETIITLDYLPSLNIGTTETQNTISNIDLLSLNIGETETQNTDTIED